MDTWYHYAGYSLLTDHTEISGSNATCQYGVHIDILYVYSENIAWLHKKCTLATGRIYGIFWQAWLLVINTSMHKQNK